MSEAPRLTESAELLALIKSRIHREGPITFAAFMSEALYHPEFGYYTSGRAPLGERGDYLTSPETSSVFGRLLGRHMLDVWRAAGSPVNWWIVELGPGSGRLAGDVLDTLFQSPEHPTEFRYALVETSASLSALQATVLRRHDAHVEWVSTIDDLPAHVTGHVVANEFFDALPVHRVTVEGGQLKEVYVGLDADDALADVVEELSTPALAEYFSTLAVLPSEGSLAEVNLAGPPLLRSLAARVDRGALTVIDYGYDAVELYAPWRRQGTLLAYYQQGFSADPYRRVGRQDITTHVDFTALRRAAEASGFTQSQFVTQMEFLTELGIEALVGEEDQGLEETMARRRVVHALLDPAGLGRLKVLVMTKGLTVDGPSR